jgi:hypothetical protein
MPPVAVRMPWAPHAVDVVGAVSSDEQDLALLGPGDRLLRGKTACRRPPGDAGTLVATGTFFTGRVEHGGAMRKAVGSTSAAPRPASPAFGHEVGGYADGGVLVRCRARSGRRACRSIVVEVLDVLVVLLEAARELPGS